MDAKWCFACCGERELKYEVYFKDGQFYRVYPDDSITPCDSADYHAAKQLGHIK